MPKSLWGNLSKLERVRSPKSLLDEQASVLTDATDGVLVGKVENSNFETTNAFRYDLDVVVPTLNHYTYTLLSIQYPLDLYPVQINSRTPIRQVDCQNEEELERGIASILSSAEVRKILSRLISQAS